MNNDEALLTTAELAARWKLHPRSLANARSAGTGVEFIKVGSRCRYRMVDVLAYEQARRVTRTGGV